MIITCQRFEMLDLCSRASPSTSPSFSQIWSSNCFGAFSILDSFLSFPMVTRTVFPVGGSLSSRLAEWSCRHTTRPNRITASACQRGAQRECCPHGGAWPKAAGTFYCCLASRLFPPQLEICRPPSGFLSQSVICGAPDGRFVDMITRLDYRMDDTVAASQAAAHEEVVTPLFNLSSGAWRLAPALG